MNDKLIIFTRYPEPGLTKTRLIEHLGTRAAADLQRRMTENILHEAGKHPADLEVRYYGGTHAQVTEWLGDTISCHDQGRGDLGEKLARAFEESFAKGYMQVLIIGADCPELKSDLIAEAYNSLSDHDLVIGPASDGGYYLVGLNRPCPELFQKKPWGDASLLKETLEAAGNLRLKYRLLTELHDIDRPEDLARIKLLEDLHPSISVIIPTLNEEESLPQFLEQLTPFSELEVIVADGGSCDRTIEIATGFGARVFIGPSGRGIQQNAGATGAQGDTLLFLHADCILPENFAESIHECLEKPGVIAGAFKLKIDLPGALIRLIEKGVNFRSRVLQLPYGDQAIFIKKELFERVGGFPEIAIMEDFALVRKLRSIGTIEILNTAVKTSGRRWQDKGVLQTTLINQAMIIAYLLGFSPNSLASWYRSSSRASS